jgi:uncharacterized protein with PIN domain
MKKNLSADIPEGHLALDAGVLVEMLNASPVGLLVNSAILDQRIIVHTSFVNLAEAEYILCRKLGHGIARDSVEKLLDSGYVSVQEDLRMHAIASRLKCERAISFADCYTFAVAVTTSSRPLFLLKENEIVREMNRKPFEVEPLFLT